MENTRFKYKAFVSYRHKDLDRKWAKWLINKIESYRTPQKLVDKGVLRKTGKLFRDDDEIPASSDLGDQLNLALRESEYLIVVCSPDTPSSKWVAEEIKTFHELGRADKIIPLLIEGEPCDSFPELLRRSENRKTESDGSTSITYTEVEPLAADIRPRTDESHADTKQRALFRLLAVLLKCGYDDLKNRELERKRKQRFIWSFFSVCLIVILSALSIYSWQQAKIAKANEATAIKEKNRALKSQSEFLISAAQQENRKGNYDTALLLGLNAFPGIYGGERPTPDTIAPIATAVYEARRKTIYPHTSQLEKARISPDGRYILTIPSDNKLYVWEKQSGKLIYTFRHDRWMNNARFSHDSQLIAAIDNGQNLMVWSLLDGKLRYSKRIGKSQFDLQFSKDNSSIYVGANNQLVRVDALTGRVLTRLPLGKAINKMSIHPSEKYLLLKTLAVSSEGFVAMVDLKSNQILFKRTIRKSYSDPVFNKDGSLFIISSNNIATLYDSSNGNKLYSLPHEALILDTAFSPKENWVVTSSRDKKVTLWSTENGKKLVTYSHNYPIHNVAISPNNKLLATSSPDGFITIWDIADSSVRANLRSEKFKYTLIFDKTSEQLVTINPAERSTASVVLWDIGKSNYTRDYIHGAAVSKSLYVPFYDYLITISKKTAQVYHAKTGERVKSLEHDKDITHAYISPNGKLLITDSYAKETSVWELDKLNLVGQFTNDGYVKSAISADSSQLITLLDQALIGLWDLKEGQLKEEIRIDSKIKSMTFIPNREKIAVLSEKRVVDLITLNDKSVANSIPIQRVGGELSASQNGELIIGKDYDEIVLWNSQSGEPIFRLAHDKIVQSYDMNSNKNLLVSSNYQSFDATLWDLKTGKLLKKFTHAGQITHVKLSDDGQWLLTSSRDKTTTLWNLNNYRKHQVFYHQQQVLHADFVDGNRWVVTSASDKLAKQWRIFDDLDDLMFQAKAKLPVNRKCLTEAERKMYFLPDLQLEQQAALGCLTR